MEIYNRNGHSQAFTGVRMNTSKMDHLQKRMSYKMEELLKIQDSTLFEGDSINVYLLPEKTNKSTGGNIIVRYMDTLSGNFLKDAEGKSITHKLENLHNESYWKLTDEIVATVKKVVDGTIARPIANLKRLRNGTGTDFAKLQPEEAKRMANNFKSYVKDLSPHEGEASAVEHAHNDIYERTHLAHGVKEF